VITALENARRNVARHLATADADRVTSTQAAELVTLFAEIERLGAAGKVLYAGRAAQSMVWRDQGHRSAASWIAQKTGVGIGDAMATLETAEALGSLPETSEALRRGELSAPQVKVIAEAAATDPRAEAELLKAAASDGLKGLRERAAQVRAVAGSAAEEIARYKAVRAARYVRHWADPDGAFRLDAKLTPDAGARLISALESEADVRSQQFRGSPEQEHPAAYMADALVALVAGDPTGPGDSGPGPEGPSGPTRATGSGRPAVSIRVDAVALRRGYVEGGETCLIPGVGPIPVATVTNALSDAYVKLFVVDGADILSVCHVGRTVPAHVQSALEARDPTCVVPGCDTAKGLENHHWQVPYFECGTSTLDNLARVCWWHHSMITYEGYVLSGGPGSWEMRAPPGGCSFETG